MTSFCRTIACPYYWRLAVAAGGSRCIFQLQMFCRFFLPLFSEFSPPVRNVKHRKNFAFELDGFRRCWNTFETPTFDVGQPHG